MGEELSATDIGQIKMRSLKDEGASQVEGDFYSYSLEMSNGVVMPMSHFRGKIVVFNTVCSCSFEYFPSKSEQRKAFHEGRLVLLNADHYHTCQSQRFNEDAYNYYLYYAHGQFGGFKWTQTNPTYLTAPVTPTSSIWQNPIWEYLKCPNTSRQTCHPICTAIVDPTGRLTLVLNDADRIGSLRVDHVDALLKRFFPTSLSNATTMHSKSQQAVRMV